MKTNTRLAFDRKPWRLDSMAFIAIAAVSQVAGCGPVGDRPPLAEVRGVVTFDGQPIDRVLIRFQPEGNRASAALTDADGRYRLRYIRDVMGAAVGDHQVTFEDHTAKRRIPDSYLSEPMSQAVESGSNEIDFELSSSG